MLFSRLSSKNPSKEGQHEKASYAIKKGDSTVWTKIIVEMSVQRQSAPLIFSSPHEDIE